MVNDRILRDILRDDYFSDAVRYFWDTRASQAEDQNNRGTCLSSNTILTGRRNWLLFSN